MGARMIRGGLGRKRELGLATFAIVALAAASSLSAGAMVAAILYYKELEESMSVRLTILNMTSGLRYQIADRLIHSRTTEFAQLLDENPVAWLERPPLGYVGIVRHGAVSSLARGSWFYDTDRGELGYVPELSFHLTMEGGGTPPLRWRVQGLRMPRPGEVEGLMIASITPYRWF